MLITKLLLTLMLAATVGVAGAQTTDDAVVQAREAFKKKNAAQLATARLIVNRVDHPLAQWVEYWELGNRLANAQQDELEAFYKRWSGTYVEDRLRNDWLLELGRRRDWANIRVEFPRFRMNDDRVVTCYALLAQHLGGQDVSAAALVAWHGQRDPDDACDLLAQTLHEARVLDEDGIWLKARLSLQANRPRAARAAVALFGPRLESAIDALLADPARYLARRGQAITHNGRELALLALIRLSTTDPDSAAGLLEDRWQQQLPQALAATAWAHVAKQAAQRQSSLAAAYAHKAWGQWEGSRKAAGLPPWGDELLAWHARAALRASDTDKQRWTLVQRAVVAMSGEAQADSTWVYWKARADLALAAADPAGDIQRSAARLALATIAPQLNFYGKLASEELGQRAPLPPAPTPLSSAEREGPRQHSGLARALKLIALGLRSEGVREWNFTLRGMNDRQLLAAAQLACENQVWDRCINTSERTRGEVDITQRYPTPHRALIEARSRQAGLDPALVYGLIRQESRFITDARSGVGASGLMQLMPATASWTAKQLGLAYGPQMINEREINLQLGTAYLKRVLDDLNGSLPMAVAAYNAGPGRPRRWREGAVMESAAWAENIPFNETRDYVKKVLANSIDYAAVLGQPVPSLKSLLGGPIGPRAPGAVAPDKEIP